MAIYYTLIERHGNGRWGVAFGDYDLDVVKDERDDFLDHDTPRHHLHILVSQDAGEHVRQALEDFERKREPWAFK